MVLPRPPGAAGLLTPLLVLVGAALIPYVDRGNLTATRPSERKTAVVLFTLFCALGLTLTFVVSAIRNGMALYQEERLPRE